MIYLLIRFRSNANGLTGAGGCVISNRPGDALDISITAQHMEAVKAVVKSGKCLENGQVVLDALTGRPAPPKRR
jgi:hypothetical protein